MSTLEAQINVTFGGVTNFQDPLTITINSPVIYVVTTHTLNIPDYGGSEAPIFVINGADYGPIYTVTGNVTFTVTSGGVSTTYPIQSANGDTLNPNVPNGIVLEGPSVDLNVGDVLTLNPGTLTAGMESPFSTLPRNGLYPTYVVDGYSRVLSPSDVSSEGHSTFFTGEVPVSSEEYYLQFANGNPFGYYTYLPDPHYIYHFDLGYEYIFDANDGKDGVYLYDFASQTFFYTSPTFPFPYLYDFTLNTILYYYPDPNNTGRYNTDGVRYFYDFSTGSIITK